MTGKNVIIDIPVDAQVISSSVTIDQIDGSGRLHVNARLVAPIVLESSGTVGPVAAGNFRYDTWPGTPITIPGGSFVDVYTRTGPVIVHELVWQLSDKKIFVRLDIDGTITMNVDTEELVDLFLVNASNAKTGFTLREYEANRWVLRPPVPIVVNNQLKVQIKGNDGSSYVAERGYAVYGPQ